MLGMGILLFASMIAISQMFVVIGGPMVPNLLADMPTIFHYTPDGQRVPEYLPVLAVGDMPVRSGDAKVNEKEFAESFPSLAMYGLTVKIALGIFIILLMLAGLSYFFEEFNIVRQGTAYGIVAKMVILIPIYMVLPYLWDTVALVIESSSLYLMDPFGGDPHARTSELWCMMGSVACSIDGSTSINPIDMFDYTGSFDRESTLSQDSWNNALQNPILGEEFIVNVLLALFKGFSIMFMTAMMFVLSAIRVLLTEVIVISFPLVSAIGLVPWINTSRISDMFQQNLIGLSMAPVMSAMVLSVGMSTIEAQNMPPLRMWFQLLSVGFLAVFFPVMLSPMLGNISTKVGNMVSTSITSASVAGSSALKGMTHGMSQASAATGMGGLARSINTGNTLHDRVSSSDIGAATSGASLGSLRAIDKVKMYGTAGAIGMLSGLGSGMIQSGAKAVGVGGTSHVSDHVASSGDVRIEGIAQNTLVDNTVRNLTGQMIKMENSGVDGSALEMSDSTLMNPGSGMNSMIQDGKSFDAGQRLACDHDAQLEFSRMCRDKTGISISPESQARLEEQIAEQIRMHPSAAAKMFADMKAET